jgi:restriction system protein
MGDESGEQKNQGEKSELPAKPEGTPQSVPDHTGPFFLDDRSSNMAAHHVMHAHIEHRAAAAFSGSGGVEIFPPFPLLVDAPSLLLQTVIVAGERTNEGKLIEAVTLPWFDIIALLEKDPSIAYQLSWEKWEELVAGTYKESGFDEVILTPRSGDHGRDVIATMNGVGFIRVIDSVKAFKPPHLVGYDDVRALIGVLHSDGASKGFLTTTSDFAPNMMRDPLITRWIPSQLQLVNGTMLLARLQALETKRRSFG